MDSADRGLNQPAPIALADHERREPPAGHRSSPQRVRAQAPTRERGLGQPRGYRGCRGYSSCSEAGRVPLW